MSASHNFSAADIQKAAQKGIENGLKIVMVEVQAGLREMLTQTPSGRPYRGGRKGTGSYRRRSAAGEPPAVDTGTLLRSVQAKPIMNSHGNYATIRLAALVAGINVDQRVPRWLEEGTSQMAARPFVAPVLDAIRETAPETIQLQVGIAIRVAKNKAMKSA